jgi:hypothetical protein
MYDARNSYTQYVPIGYRLLGRYLDKAYNSVPGGVGSNPPHGISNRLWALRVYTEVTGRSSWDDVH